tara:strand:- start:3482 stop:4165 length:684 start_codon:yes stop_codon:yes gene_type:complete
MKNVIGLSGLATSGKDLFFDMLSEEIKCKGFSLASALKQTLRNSILEDHNIDVFNCSPEEKKIIRPILVEYGTQKRRESEGQCWIETLSQTIDQSNLDKDTTIIITDVRYNIYKNDEASWVRNKLGGILVYIKKYKLTENGIALYTTPPNDEERRNDPLVRNAADYTVNWQHINGRSREETKAKLRPHIINFLNWREDNAGRRRKTSQQLQRGRMRKKLRKTSRKTL